MSSAPHLGVVDYGMGNRRSVLKAIEHVGARAAVTCDHEELLSCDGLVIPGVGAFPLAMRRLSDLGLRSLILTRAGEGTPLLGICLGMQLLFDSSIELEQTAGLGLLAGEVGWLRSEGRRIPHIGWNDVTFERRSPLTVGLPEGGCPFYHVHSLVARPRDPADIVASAEYGERFATIVGRGSVFGVQFHPEKSSAQGLQLLRAFVMLCADRPSARAAVGSARA